MSLTEQPSGRKDTLLIALAGQQNAGKSTLFNALTGLQQHIANYPGVTVDKKSGFYTHNGQKIEIVDLPGTYALTSFSPEERVARNFLLNEPPDLIVNVADASNLERSLLLTFQLMALERPMLLVLNMMDMAERLGLTIDTDTLSRHLGIPVIATIGSKRNCINALKETISEVTSSRLPPPRLHYGELEETVTRLEKAWLPEPPLPHYPARWAVTQYLEEDNGIIQAASTTSPQAWQNFVAKAGNITQPYQPNHAEHTADILAKQRSEAAKAACKAAVQHIQTHPSDITEQLDRFLLNRLLAPFFLLLTIWIIYQLSIVEGYELAKAFWPVLAWMRHFIGGLLPEAGFLFDSPIRSMGLWMIDSANTLLNYVPIFLVLFSLIAILEDSGYMARIAFILDRILHRFGLHGQSTLPLILAGVFAGGCAVPGVMATKGIPDTRARMATILTVPFMNCLAKIPLYTLLVNIYFPNHKGLVLFYIATITIIAALLVSKLLTGSILRKMETAPFVMELPHYHLPGIKSVLRRAIDRTWIYVKKVGSIVLAVATVVYALLQFPGLSKEQETAYIEKGKTAIARFYTEMEGNPHLQAVSEQENLFQLINVYNEFRAEKLLATTAEASQKILASYSEKYPQFQAFLQTDGDKAAKKAARSLKKLDNARKDLRREMKEMRIENSILGTIGRSMEPVTQFANFNWKINVALLSSFAARESSVATLGVLFGQDDEENATLEERMGNEQQEQGYDALTAAALILFFALYPPCLATTIMIRIQTGSYRWMLFSIIFPTLLGFVIAGSVYTLGNALGWSGLQAFSYLYAAALTLLLIVGLHRKPVQSSP